MARTTHTTSSGQHGNLREADDEPVEKVLEDQEMDEGEAEPNKDEKTKLLSKAELMAALDKEMSLLTSLIEPSSNTQSEQ